MLDLETVKNNIPDYITRIAKTLNGAGYECYLVGGAVRDIAMGKVPNDFDLTTDATPEEIIKLFPKSVGTGMKFGTITVLSEGEGDENFEVHITTYRSEADYVDGRWPSYVEFTKDIMKDLGRRDFTINAIAIKLPLDDNLRLLDPFDGLKDIKRKIIRAVGTPSDRFREDGLRAFKACRLAAVLNFQIEPDTFKAISQTKDIASKVSMERIRDEFLRMVYEAHKPSRGIEIMRITGLLELFLPELLEGVGVEGGPYHNLTVYKHLLNALDIAPDRIKLAALFHDIAKPRCSDGKGHFYGHDIMGEKMTREILTRLRLPKKEVERNALLVRWHMFYYPYEEELSFKELQGSELRQESLKEDGNVRDSTPASGINDISGKNISEEENKEERRKADRRIAFEKGWSDKAIRKLIRHVGGAEFIDDLIELRIVDALANPKSSFDPSEVRAIQARISDVLAGEVALSVKHLAIDGKDLIGLGFNEGPVIGEVFEYLLERVTHDPNLNTEGQLLKLAKDYKKK